MSSSSFDLPPSQATFCSISFGFISSTNDIHTIQFREQCETMHCDKKQSSHHYKTKTSGTFVGSSQRLSHVKRTRVGRRGHRLHFYSFLITCDNNILMTVFLFILFVLFPGTGWTTWPFGGFGIGLLRAVNVSLRRYPERFGSGPASGVGGTQPFESGWRKW